MMRLLLVFLILLYTLRAHAQAQAQLTVSYFLGGSENDAYNADLLKLALEKTRATYGDYQLSPITIAMTPKRRKATLEQNQFPNLVVMLAYLSSAGRTESLISIDIPIDFGVLGWRICFVNSRIKEQITHVKTLDELSQYSIAQGAYWRDNDILRENGFRVIESSSYPALFSMVARGRADLFCRGIAELFPEYEKFKAIGELYYDESFALSYSMPIFFHLHKSNQQTKQRLELGLKIAYEDGSLMRLWLNRFHDSLILSNIKQRKVFYLKSSITATLPKDYEKYLINPQTLQ